ncbi:MAG: fatty acid desaturase [Alphaproteobacteria bacterium]|nr:fatty acid desaturase [Alphaproteobacteria bacterium]
MTGLHRQANDAMKISRDRQAAIGMTLAAVIIAAWAAIHVAGVFFMPLRFDMAWLIVPMVLVQCWLYVGMFVVAHDCMHGSLVPFRPAINRVVGQVCMTLYAGFNFDAMNRKHHAHHRHPGTADDPDFDEEPPHSFLAWYWKFFTEYFGWREYLFIAVTVLVYIALLGADIANVLVFWTLPALLSSVQLFTFGTYLPHRPDNDDFADRHNARTNLYPRWTSLLTCFHFGYHHEHHLQPGVPWWRLPGAHAEYLAERRSGELSNS